MIRAQLIQSDELDMHSIALNHVSWGGDGHPPPSFIICRKSDGSPASTYGDTIWDFSAYHSAGRSARINLSSWRTESTTDGNLISITSEIRWILFILITLRHGPSLSVSSLHSYMRLFREMARFAEHQSVSLTDVLTNVALMRSFVATSNGPNLGCIRILLKTLNELGVKKIGFKPVACQALTMLETLAKTYKSKHNQSSPIPTRIYTEIISNLSSAISEFETLLDRYVLLVETCHSSPLIGRSETLQRKWHRKNPGSALRGQLQERFPDVLSRFDLTEYFAKWDLVKSVQGMTKGLTDVQLVCKLLIQAYSGMRDEEAATLNYLCLEEKQIDGRKCFHICGRTTKLNHGQAKVSRWVTSHEGVRAIRCAQSIARFIYRLAGKRLSDLETTLDRFPLFVSASYLGFAGVLPRPGNNRFASSHLDTFNMKELFARILPVITDQDICELEHIDAYRAWRAEDRFTIGRQWPLTSHQFRRSLALYASRSGFVTLPSLRRQLQHITEEMSRYYSNGSTYALDLFGGKRDHFSTEWQKTQPESEALAYIQNVMLADVRLFGGHGAWAEAHCKTKGILSLEDRDKTVKRFKKGEMAYRETPLGGCTSVDVCDKRPLRSVIACLDCGRAVIKLSKLQMVMKAQENLVLQLDPATVEGRVENDDLQILIATHERLKQKNK